MKKVLILFFCLLLPGMKSFAITDEEVSRNFQFSFVNPGARANAMGNAFVALADDATAAEANPAGLTILTKPEVSFEYRNIRFDQDRLNSINDVSATQETIRIESLNDLESLNRPSFFSFVYPKGRNTFAFSRQEAVRVSGNIDEVFTINLPGSEPDLVVSNEAVLEQDVTNWNFTVARKITDQFSIGGGVRISQLDWQSDVQNFLIFFGNRFDDFQTKIDDSDTALAWNLGAIYRIHPSVSVGAVYKRNAKFEVIETETGILASKPGPFTNTLKIPDVFGFGVAAKPNDSIVITSDIVRIQYSDLLDDFSTGYNFVTATADSEDVSFQVDDAWEFHVGAEIFVLVKDVPIAIRQGYYRKPSNALVAANTSGLAPLDAEVVRTIFVEGEDENHLTLGAGFVWSDFQIDWAVDASKSVTNFILSGVFRF